MLALNPSTEAGVLHGTIHASRQHLLICAARKKQICSDIKYEESTISWFSIGHILPSLDRTSAFCLAGQIQLLTRSARQ
jgi:hypothetical protein